MKNHKIILAMLPLIGMARTARSTEIKTDDGLSLRLSETGAIESLAVGAQPLRLLPQKHPITAVEFSPNAVRQNMVPNPGVEDGGAAPTSWSGPPTSAIRTDEFNHTPHGHFSGKISTPAEASESHPAIGGSFRCTNIPAKPNTPYVLRAWGRVPKGGSGGNVFAAELDSNGRVLTQNKLNVQHNLGWQNAPRDQWTPLERTFTTRPDCAQVYVYANIWKGYGTFYFDDVELFEQIALWKEVELSPTELTSDPRGCWSQHLSSPGQHLDIHVCYAVRPDHIRIETSVQDLHDPPHERAIRARYALPIDAANWIWHDDGRTSRTIATGGIPCHNTQAIGGCRVSAYPFTSISKEGVGLSLGAPMDCPRLQDFACDAATGYATVVDLGLSSHTTRIGPGKATFTTILYCHDGHWGLRAAAKKFYSIFPEHFAKRSKRDGMWLYAAPLRPIPHPEDFGFAFYEGWFPKAEDRALLREKGIYLFPYVEPWGARQVFPQAQAQDDMPPYEDRLAELKHWAEDKQAKDKLLGGPRWEVARAILNSMPLDPEGRAYFHVDKYGSWAQWWMTNPSPLLPEPNRGTTCRRYEIEPFLAEADGIYLDSVTSWLGKDLDFRPDHLAHAMIPPTFDGLGGRPALLGILSWYDFMDCLAADLHRTGKLVQMNIFANSYRFCAHLADVLGSEVGWTRRKRGLADVETDATSLTRRMLAFQKPTSNLLQEGDFKTPQPELPSSEIEAYIKHQMFYGFFPGIATIGGEDKPGYAGWKRYFGTPTQYERDRPLFGKYIPIIQALCAAGWEPVTYARTSTDDVFVERFGSWENNDLLFTLRNNGEKEQACTVNIQAAKLGAGPSQLERLAARELVSNVAPKLAADEKAGVIALTMTMCPKDTAVVRLDRNP